MPAAHSGFGCLAGHGAFYLGPFDLAGIRCYDDRVILESDHGAIGPSERSPLPDYDAVEYLLSHLRCPLLDGDDDQVLDEREGPGNYD